MFLKFIGRIGLKMFGHRLAERPDEIAPVRMHEQAGLARLLGKRVLRDEVHIHQLLTARDSGAIGSVVLWAVMLTRLPKANALGICSTRARGKVGLMQLTRALTTRRFPRR